MTRKFEVMITAVLLALALIGCQSVVSNTSKSGGKPDPTHEIGIPESPASLPSKPGGYEGPIGIPETPNVLDSLIAKAVADLAARLGIDAGEIQVIKTESATWGDTSLGVPEPDKMYAQVLTPGYQIWLGFGAIVYTYHTDYARVVFAGEAP